MRPGRAPFFLPLLFVFTAVTLVWLLVYPPLGALDAAAHHVLGPSVRWESITRDGGKPVWHRVQCATRPVGFEADRVRLESAVWQGIFLGIWSFEAHDARFMPQKAQWPPVSFSSGKGTWHSRARALDLTEWTSEWARIETHVRWDSSAHVQAARIAGEANPATLRDVLRPWKQLPDDAAASDSRLRFRLEYNIGALQIWVDEKPFFRASWHATNNAF